MQVVHNSYIHVQDFGSKSFVKEYNNHFITTDSGEVSFHSVYRGMLTLTRRRPGILIHLLLFQNKKFILL